ncbi:hypothetical protein DAPPUDRAFT_242278 [Daphnia pulex]|uniref:BTB domain-containing protein n=1 Tax=Daphnia pulex TaxID=6669 RepID=E9GG99_DAPPU|nr:hypothetical protein DAPPUDRAFT_242278 [Daphnia pulex]|eukprot:EFX81533.1 hypothetical protein DAPPUDRAFT_242278 [Daphnia pulex]
MDIDVVKHFLKFLYTGCLEISATIKQLRELAKMYEMETLMEICQLANCSPDATSKLDASKIYFLDKPSAFPFRVNLRVVNHFLSFRRTGDFDLDNWTHSPGGFGDASANIEQMTALAKMYDVGPFNKICQLDRSVPLDLDEITTFLLTAL